MKRLLLLLFFVGLPPAVSAQTASIEYTLTAKDPLSHLYAIEIEISGIRSTSVDVAMPAWSPGVYAIRNFAGSVQQIEVRTRQNRRLEFEQIDKQTWRISKQIGDDVRMRYSVYSSAFNDEMADILPASVFMYVAGRTPSPVSVKYETEGSWKVYTALEKHGDRYVAPDYDTLATSPVFLGEFKVLEFKSGNVPYRVVFTNPRTQMTLPQIESDLQDLAGAAVSMFGTAPFKDYTFLVKVQAASAATSLGYPNSSRLTVGENDFANQAGYAAFISAAAQGLVKAWYGRAARPRSMAPYDYSRESYTRLLWFTEGVAAYSADMLLIRSGVLNSVEYFVKSSADVDALQHQAGRLITNLEEASWNTWTRSDNSVNTGVSYVLKGKIAGLLLDAEIRGRTAGAQSLDAVLRHLLSQSEVRREGLADNALEPAIEAATGVSAREYFDAVVRGKNEIDYNRYLEKIGIHADSMKGPATVFFGMEFERNEANQARVRRAIPGSPSEAARVDTGDVVIALDSERVTFDNLVGRIHSKPLGKSVAITVLRGERLLTLTLTPGLTQTEKWSLGELLTATPEQVRLRTAWLGAPPATRGLAPR
jgi:predicted metalloprotease with PDZ domain